MKSIILHSIQTSGMNLVQAVCGFLISIILARSLGPEQRGEYALVVLIAGTTAMLCNPSIYASANYFLSTGQWNVPQAFGTVVLTSSLFGSLGALAAVCMLLLINTPDHIATNANVLAAVIALTLSTTISSSVNGLFYGSKKIRSITNWKITFSILQLIALAVLSLYSRDTISFLLVFSSLSVFDAVTMILIFSLREKIHFKLEISLIEQTLRYGTSVYLSRILLFLSQRIGAYMVLFLAGTLSLGYYTIAVSFAEQLWLLPLATSLVMMTNLGRHSLQEATNLTVSTARMLLLLAVTLSLVLSLVMPWCILILYGSEYQPAVAPFLLLLPGTVAFSLYAVVEPFFQWLGKPQIALKITIIGTFTTILTSLILLPLVGVSGAALASSIGFIVQLIVTCFKFWQMTEQSPWALLRVDLALTEGLQYLRNYRIYLSDNRPSQDRV